MNFSQKPLRFTTSYNTKLACNPSTQEAETGRSRVGDQTRLDPVSKTK
jgi:hypothetical protein